MKGMTAPDPTKRNKDGRPKQVGVHACVLTVTARDGQLVAAVALPSECFKWTLAVLLSLWGVFPDVALIDSCTAADAPGFKRIWEQV
jgi:hypothetical protein